MKVYWRRLSPNDYEELLSLSLRIEDNLELQASLGLTGPIGIAECLIFSEHTWVGILDGKIECVFGLGADPPNVGIPWLVGTDNIDKFSMGFLRESKVIIELMLSYYPILTNLVAERHTKAIKWLKWLGFSFTGERYYQLDPDVPFLKFTMLR